MSETKKGELPTVEIPAPLYDAALAFCNERLWDQGRDPITELPAGMPQDPGSCPCAKACGVYVERLQWSTEQTPMSSGSRWLVALDPKPLPELVTEFVDLFDGRRGEVGFPLRDKVPHLPVRVAP